MRSPVIALLEAHRAKQEERAKEQATQQAHLEKGIRWIVAEQTDLSWMHNEVEAKFELVEALYMLSACTVCGRCRACHIRDEKKHLRINGGTG